MIGRDYDIPVNYLEIAAVLRRACKSMRGTTGVRAEPDSFPVIDPPHHDRKQIKEICVQLPRVWLFIR